MLQNTSVVKALLKEGFFIVRSSENYIKLENKEGIKFQLKDFAEGDEYIYGEFTKYIEIGNVSFIYITLNGYSQILNNYEKALNYLKNAPIG